MTETYLSDADAEAVLADLEARAEEAPIVCAVCHGAFVPRHAGHRVCEPCWGACCVDERPMKGRGR